LYVVSQIILPQNILNFTYSTEVAAVGGSDAD